MRWVVLVAVIAGCRTEVFDHTRAQADGGLEAGVPESCGPGSDGDPCDDHDLCTPASSCMAGACVPGNAFESCVVADTERDFSEEQGGSGWYYGYYSAGTDEDGSYDSAADFAPMEYCGSSTWKPPGRCGDDSKQPGYRWTMNLAWGLQHPETQPELELPVRRWISDASGPARIAITHRVGGTAGDGTRALLLIDGREVWRNDAEPGDEHEVRDELQVELRMGTEIEQLLHPIESSADDMTYFAITVEGR
jgi:hypothetical protein